MFKIVSIAAVAAVAFVANANALTFKKGEVLTSSGEVVKASETRTGQNALASDGFLVAGGVAYISLNGETIEVDVAELRGKSKAGIIEVIGEAAGEQLGDLIADVEDHVAEIGENAMSAVGQSAADLVAEGLAGNVDTFVGVSEQMAQEMHEGFIASGEAFFDPETGTCHNCP